MKLEFLNADPESYTINVTSLNDKKGLETILIEKPSLYEKSYEFDYFNGTQLLRWNYGIYQTYDEAQNAIQSLGDSGVLYYPTVQKVSKEQELYNSNILPAKNEPEKKPEFEYIEESSKTEYKEAVPLKDYVQEKPLEIEKLLLNEKTVPTENKIKDLMQKLDEEKPQDKIVNTFEKLIEDKIEEKIIPIEKIEPKVKDVVKIDPIGGDSKPNKLIDDEVRIIPRKLELGLDDVKATSSEAQ